MAFVRGSELFTVDVASRRETQLTRGAPEGVTRGQSDFNGQEEFDEPSGYWISPTCDKIAYLEVDEREVGTHPVLGYRGGKVDLMMQKYPGTGAKNPKVRAFILDVKTKKTTWIKWPSADEKYFGRFRFSADGKALYAQTLTRDQKRLSLARIDPVTGDAKEIIVETSPTWIDFADMRLFEKSPKLLWTRDIGGHIHLELRDAVTGSSISELTSGEWDVEGINAVDEDHNRALVTATKDGPLERQLYAVPLAKGGEIRRLTQERGVHSAIVEAEGRGLVDVHSALDRLPKAVIHGADGAAIADLPAPVDPELETLKLRTPEIIKARGPSGDTLYGALLKPRTIDPGRRYPVVVMIYGGPGFQTVLDAWQPYLAWNHLADRGVVVFQLDNRGTPGRGVAFEHALYDHIDDIEIQDQIAGLDEISKLPFVDGTRVGIHGGSYGGSMTLVALLKAPDRFKVGVSSSPVTDSRLYDSGYQERYMGTPEKHPKAYETAELTKFAPNLRGKLLLTHGLMDENVHFQNTAQMIDALIEAKKPFDLLVLPGERHGTRKPATRQYVMQRVVDYLTENL
ncbi:MAG: DPP IV N-terminal domain-containing protein [Minicystis sp.]